MNIKDIAKIAGVGVSTVSRVINNHNDVKEETRQKVIEIIKEYNYIPNNSARNLKRITSKNIGVLVDGRHNPFFYEIINIIGNKVQENGYSMIMKNNQGFTSDISAAKEFIIEKKLAGIVCIGLDFDCGDFELIKTIEIPVVLVSSNLNKTKTKSCFSSISIDDYKSSYNATKLILSYGHREVGIISAEGKDELCSSLRLKGYKKALEDFNCDINLDFIKFGDYSFKSGYDAMKKILNNSIRPTAVFVISDIMAIGAAKACLEAKIRIPEDMSIVGFDGIEYGQYYQPAITTVKQPFESMAIKSVELIMQLINKQCKNKHIILNTKIVKRDSLRELK